MSLAKPADPQTPNSTRERTDCISSLVTHAALVVVSLLSRLVSLLKSERDADNKAKKLIDGEMVAWNIFYTGPRDRSLSMHNEDWLEWVGGLHLMIVYKETYIEASATVLQKIKRFA
jgi:hypothetical protein